MSSVITGPQSEREPGALCAHNKIGQASMIANVLGPDAHKGWG